MNDALRLPHKKRRIGDESSNERVADSKGRSIDSGRIIESPNWLSAYAAVALIPLVQNSERQYNSPAAVAQPQADQTEGGDLARTMGSTYHNGLQQAPELKLVSLFNVAGQAYDLLM